MTFKMAESFRESRIGLYYGFLLMTLLLDICLGTHWQIEKPGPPIKIINPGQDNTNRQATALLQYTSLYGRNI